MEADAQDIGRSLGAVFRPGTEHDLVTGVAAGILSLAVMVTAATSATSSELARLTTSCL